MGIERIKNVQNIMFIFWNILKLHEATFVCRMIEMSTYMMVLLQPYYRYM